jgi:hypothetical protein
MNIYEESLADFDIIWKNHASKETNDLKKLHLNQVIEAQQWKKSDKHVKKESRALAKKVLNLAMAELKKIED